MPLPSQTARPIARRNHMYRRSRHRRRPTALLVGAAVVVVAAGGWYFWPEGEAEAEPGPAAGGKGQPDLVAANGGQLPSSLRERPGVAERTEAQPSGREEQTLPAPPVGERIEREAVDPGPGAIEMGGSTDPAPVASERAESRPEPEADASGTSAERSASSHRPTGNARESAPTEEAQRAYARAQRGLDLLARNQPVEGRRLLSEALETSALSDANETMVREQLTALNERLVFSPEIVADDPFSLAYAIEPNDALARLPRKLGVQVDWRFLQRINRIERPERIRPKQRIKVVTGPFHAVVHKNQYRMDLYLDDGTERVYVRSLPVGLGEYNSTPEGRFRVRSGSKLINPEWVNPRTGQRYLPEDPLNPIGEFWIGLVGDEPHLQSVSGYGIHGTIEPDSIGRQASMGCVRMLPEDIELVWQVLTEGVSTVEIRP